MTDHTARIRRLLAAAAAGALLGLASLTTGVFEVTLTVTDDDGDTGSVTKKMVVEISS